MFISTLLSLLFLAISVAAKPIVIRDNLVHLPLSKKVNITAPGNLVKQAQARAAFLQTYGFSKRSGTHRERDNVQRAVLHNVDVGFVAETQVGTPSTTYSLLVDTGSSNTWVGAGKSYIRTSSSKFTGNSESVSYASGWFSGSEFLDTVSFGDGVTVLQQSIGVARTAQGFGGLDGVLGLGPSDLTIATVANKGEIPTVTDNLFSQGVIPENLVSIFFAPSTPTKQMDGEITFGGVDSSKYVGEVVFASIASTSPADQYWGFDQIVRYGSETTILPITSSSGIIDTATPFILLATDAFQKYMFATGAVMDGPTGLLRISPAQYSSLQSLFFTIDNIDFEFPANAQIWPRALNKEIGGSEDNIYLIVNDMGTDSGQGLDFINGMPFLERFYTVYDTTNKQVGFAETAYTFANSN